MRSANPWLFDPDDLPVSPGDRSLAVRSTSGRPLGKEERAFNRALARLQVLTREMDEEKRRLDRLLVFHAAEIRPRADRAVALRASLVRAVAPFLDDRRLTKAQRRVLRRILIEQLDDVLAYVEQPEPDLQFLFERLHDISYAQAVQDDLKEAQAGMAAIFDELGLDIELPELHPDMTEEEAAAAAARLAHELRLAEGRRAAAPRSRAGVPGARPLRAGVGQGKAARAAEERARRHEQLRKDSLGAVYRRLVKALHPDVERDPSEREKKSRVMQDITAAYAEGNLHALLRLELEWLRPGHDAARLSVDKLRAYTELLKQQAAELEADVQSLRHHPRYAPLIVEGPFDLPMLIDGPRELERLDAVIGQIGLALERLSSGDAIEEVRGAVRAYQDAEKRHTLARRRREPRTPPRAHHFTGER